MYGYTNTGVHVPDGCLSVLNMKVAILTLILFSLSLIIMFLNTIPTLAISSLAAWQMIYQYGVSH